MPIPKWLPMAAFLFVLFLIYNNPTDAGATAGNFAGFVVELLGAVGEFLTGLFEGTNDGVTSSGGTGTGTTVAESVESGADVADSFSHTHDGITHTHPGSEN